MHRRRRRRIWGRFLSIALAVMLTMTSCYTAPVIALADDGGSEGEPAVTETVTVQPEAAEISEPTPSEQEVTAETPDQAPEAEVVGEETDPPNPESINAEGEGPEAAEGSEIIDPDAENSEDTENAEDPAAAESEEPVEEAIETGEETSEFISTVALIYQYGQETETSTVTLKGNASINLSGQAKEIEGYELESITVQNGSVSAAAESILQKVGGESASLFYIDGNSGAETSIDGAVSVVFVYKETVTEEEKEEEKKPEVIDQTIRVFANGSQISVGTDPVDVYAIGEEAAEEGQILTGASYINAAGNEVGLHYVKNVAEENVRKTVFTNDEDAASGSYSSFDLPEGTDSVEIIFSYEKEKEEKKEKELKDRTLAVYVNGEQIEIGPSPVDLYALGEEAAEEGQTFIEATYEDQNGTEKSLHYIKNVVEENEKLTVYTADEDAASGRWQHFDLGEDAESVTVTFHYEEEKKIEYKSGFLRYKGGDFTVSMGYGADAKIPEDAHLDVREIPQGTSEYESYLETANGALGNSDSSAVASARFFDIVIRSADGGKIEPAASVNVRILYDMPSKVEVSDQPDVVHFANSGSAEVVGTSTASGRMVSFEAGSFSVYGVIYTVDFTYDGYTFRLPGEGSILLSQLAEELHLYETEIDRAFSVQNVEYVEFSNPGLLAVSRQDGGDWLLESLRSFTSDETLTIYMTNGSRFVIKVTDPPAEQHSSNLVDFLTGVTIQAPTNEQGAYVVEPGEEYSIIFNLKETGGGKQFDNVSLTYPMPAGLDADGHSGTFSVSIERGGQTYPIAGNSYSIENGVLTITWNQNDPNYSQLLASANVKFQLAFDGKFDEDATQIKFSDSIVKNLKVDTSSSVTTSKTANVNIYNDKVYYTATVKSDGKSQNVVLTDTITGTGLTLDPSSIQATSSTGQAVTMTGGASGNSFTYTIPEMKNGEIITFQYAADIDPSVLQMVDGKVVTQSGNTFKATSDGDPEGDQTHVSNTFDYTPKVTKSSGEVTGTDGTRQTLTWSLTVNPDAKVSAAGTRVTDTIGTGSQNIMTYSGDGIVVTVKDASGRTVRTDNVEWSDMASKTDSSWTYVIPSGDAGNAYKYEISYTTEVETKDLKKLTTVDNVVTTDGDQSGSGQGQVGPTGGGVEIKKEAVNVDTENKEVTWKVTFVVPGTGLDKAVVTDYYPHQWVGSSHEFERVKDGTVTVTGLTDGEAWTIAYDDAQAVAIITFTKDGAAGLKGTGTARTITVTLKTEISDAWVAAAREESWRVDHTNKAELDYGDKIDASAVVKIAPNEVTKTSTAETTRTVDGVELPVYKYEVVFIGVQSDSFDVTDTFDTEILEPYNDGEDAFYVFGGDQYWQGNRGSSPATHIDSATGMTINVSADSLPKNGQDYYTAYKLVYYLTVKNEAALNKLAARAAASPDGKATLENQVDWEGETDTTPVVYEYNGLDKEILTSDEDLKKTDQDIYADFRITLNPSGSILNGGNPVTMTDTVSNLSVVLTSIQATPSEGVTWDMSGNTVTYTIPDATKVVITYRARVIFTTIGETGETVAVKFSNVAEMLGFSDNVEKTAERHNSGGGTGSVPSINLLKYEAGNMTKRLSGAVFALLDSNKNPVVDKNGQEVIFTTDASGIITVEGDEESDGWTIIEDTRYHLKEISAPEGYKLSNFDYEFTVSSDGTTDYSRYIYHSGDTMSAKNYPGTDVSVSKNWSDGNDKRSDSDYVEVKLQQKIGDGEWSDTIRILENEQWTEKELPVLTLNNANSWAGKFSDLAATVPPSLPEEEGVDFVTADYRIVETKAVVNGKEIEIIDDETSDDKNVSYVVTKEGGTYVAVVTNEVETETNAELEATKDFNDWTLAPEGGFEFTLTAGTNDVPGSVPTPMPEGSTTTVDGKTVKTAKATSSESPAEFGSIQYTKPGKYVYTIQEVCPEDLDLHHIKDFIKYDNALHFVVVVVTEAADGSLSATVYYDPTSLTDPTDGTSSLSITNYAAKGEASLEAVKEVSGAEWPEEATATFTVTANDGGPLPENPSVTLTAAGTADFGKITYKLADAGKTFTYTITESGEGFSNGWSADPETITATVTVGEDNKTGTLTTTVTYDPADATITNSYSAEGEVKLEAIKELSGAEWPEGGTVTFTLSGEGGTLPETKTQVLTAAGTAKFDAITYSLEDLGGKKTETFTYTISERADGFDGWTADPSSITATVTVTDNGKGTLETSVAYDPEDKTITNSYSAEGEAELEAIKELSGAEWPEGGTVTFTLSGEGGTLPETKTQVLTAAGTAKFDAITYSLEDLGGESTKTFTYTIRESAEGFDGWTADPSSITATVTVTDNGKGTLETSVAYDPEDKTITNSYSAEGEVKLEAIKELSGAEWPEGGTVTFTLSGEGGTLPETTTKELTAAGTAKFDAITYSLEDLGGKKTETFTYTISERADGFDGWTADPSSITATVTVTDNGKGTLETSVAYDPEDKTITNSYSAEGEVKLEAVKAVSGADWPEGGKVTFTLSGEGGTLPETKTQVLTAAGTAKFDAITYSLEDLGGESTKTFTYTISESADGFDGWTADPDKITATVTVTDNGDGTLETSVVYDPEDKTITNTRETGDLEVTKTVKSSTASDKTKDFSFRVTLSDTTINGTYGDVDFTDGVATFTLKDGKTKSITGLPTGITYMVEEDTAAGFITTKTGETGTINTEKSTAAFTNRKDEGGLVVSKSVESDIDADKTKDFSFTVKLDDETVNGTYGEMSFMNGVAEFTLKDGESKAATGLAKGITYKVIETEESDFVTTCAGETGKISDTAGLAEFKNVRRTGDLTLSKTLISDAAADADQEFEFTVELSDSTISGTYGDMAFTNGSATVTLKGGESASATDLPTGIDYRITEADAEGFVQTGKTGETGTISTTESAAEFTNSRETGGLKVSKTVVSTTASDKTKEFRFTVALSDESISKTYSGVEFVSGAGKFTLKDGETKVIEGLPTGIEYTVIEEDEDGFVTTMTGETGTISKEKTAEAAFTNTKDEGGLIVSKSVESTLESDKTRDFSFTVTLDDKTVNGTYGEMTFTNGVAEFTLKDGETKTAAGLAKGIGYKVSEETDENFEVTYTGQSGVISKQTASAEVKNTRKTGGLKVTKTVVSPTTSDMEKDFNFTVTLIDATINGTYGDAEFADGVATLTLKGGETKSITGLPIGITYTIEEAEEDGFVLTGKTGDEGTISTTESKAEFTNTRETGELKVTKTVVSSTAGDKEKEFNFTVTLSDTTIEGMFGGVEFQGGVATFTLKDGESKAATGLPTGITYKVEEATAAGFITTMTGETGTISKEKAAEAAFTNTKDEGGLIVSKSVESTLESDKTRDFSFTVTLDDKTVNGTYGEMTFTNGVAEFTLKDGETKTAAGLAMGIGYTVNEEADESFEVTYTGQSGVISKQTASAEVKNTRKTGELKVTKKVVSSTAGDKKKDFNFTVTLSDTTISGTFGGMTFTNGVAAFTLKDGESKAATGLPTGITYKVEEATAAGFITTMTGETGAISKEKAAEAVFTNTKDEGGLIVKKTVESALSSDKTESFRFTVTLDDKTVAGTYGEMDFADGIASFTLKDGETKSATGLAKGISYEVKEEADNRFTIVYSGETGAIGDAISEITVTNTRRTGELDVTKSVTSTTTADKTREFRFRVKLGDTSISGTFGGMNFTDGIAEFTLKDGETKSASGLPVDVSYTVEEETAEGFTTTKTGDTGTISSTKSEAKFINTRIEGELQVTKTVNSSTASDRTRDFGFKVTLGDTSISGTYGEMTFTNGVAEFTLKHGEAKLAAGLPVGISYTVEENAGTGYTVTMTGETGSISTTRAVAAFTNTFTTPPPPPPPPTPPTPPDTPPTPPTPPDTPYVLGANRTPQVLGANRAKTGDESDLQLWLTLMMASAASLLILLKKRRRESEEA